jgi:isochorismate synthase/2-succinyl-5-enolpyruvyl-6-hydroxy-3-cyclohexene-1-carboxylate synthase/2-succinyl-6-hydroxy-2,4-cyclohexadiene-1-carboxylate synthase/O-succinylbenzoate synthase
VGVGLGPWHGAGAQPARPLRLGRRAVAAGCSVPEDVPGATALADSGAHNGGAASGASSGSGASANVTPSSKDAQQQQQQQQQQARSQEAAAAVAPPPRSPNLQPVTFIEARALPPQPGLQQAAASLGAALAAALPRLRPLSSGVVRWEVPVPRGCSAARWLRGQDVAAHHQVYFSGRHSTAPDTPKSALAEASARGWSAVAGLGAAWLWRGAPGVTFGERQLAGLQRMLSEAQPRIRLLGGTRWVAFWGTRECH